MSYGHGGAHKAEWIESLLFLNLKRPAPEV